jgi:hypothetical protein
MGNGRGIFKSFAIAVVIVLTGFLLLFEEIHFGWIIARNPIFKPLFRELATSGNSRISTYSIDSLLGMLSPNDFDFWLKVLENPSSDDYLKGHALLALRAINNPKAINSITKVYENTNKLNDGSSNSTWVWAFTALAKMKGEAFCPEILNILHNPNIALKQEAVQVIWNCPSSVAINSIKPILESPESLKFEDSKYTNFEIIDLQQKALVGISRLNSPESIQYLVRLTDSNNEYIAASSLSEIKRHIEKFPESKPTYKDIFVSKLDPKFPKLIRITAFNSLYWLYGDDSYNIIKEYINDPYLGPSAKQCMEIGKGVSSQH